MLCQCHGGQIQVTATSLWPLPKVTKGQSITLGPGTWTATPLP